ncbi:TPA: hypothetical protein DIV55_04725 [Patescibacteria group bacterium]|uniref:PD-(D/E)XK endonuclease-like domain-containing protein n=1 Tax=Candidatus Gottesmanbacteria bacterium GW2011_GWA1_43_11 TaxID=1618436 RepID=A0A0G1ES20_9BACT|nr:MAG: hypothetical protein UV59_C0004G0014 [Candidatus Gottesmanbacteria bacterium GW2011_GWA1_43_11]HCS79017.1 hypothetical protein [Patescibacteria group bacterium]
MAKDKFTAVWVSHSSISDFLKCPKAYFYNNVYRRSESGHKIKIMQPSFALGQAVHTVLEQLSTLPTSERFKESLIAVYERQWEKVSGTKGGFVSSEQEARYKERGADMLRKVMENPGPLKNLAVKINMDLPYFWLSEEDNLILCGKIDWLEYNQADDSVRIIDFKTGRTDEPDDSLQLSIYFLLAQNCQRRKVAGMSYWYLERNATPSEVSLPDATAAHEKILEIAKKIKLARQLEIYKCPQKDGCSACKPFEKVIAGWGEFIGVDDYNQDIFILPDEPVEGKEESTVL